MSPNAMQRGACRAHVRSCLLKGAGLWHALQALAQVEKRHPRGLPLLDPEEDLHIADPAFRKAQRCATLPVATESCLAEKR